MDQHETVNMAGSDGNSQTKATHGVEARKLSGLSLGWHSILECNHAFTLQP